MQLLSLCPFCLCKSLSVPKQISGSGPHSFDNLLLTVLIFSRHLHSTVAYIQGYSRAVAMAWIICSGLANGETEAYRRQNLHMVPQGLSDREENLLWEPPEQRTILNPLSSDQPGPWLHM